MSFENGRKASIALNYYNPRDLCHPEEIEVVEAEYEEDDKTMEDPDPEVSFCSYCNLS